MLNSRIAQKICQNNRVTSQQAVRFVRARWERTYLKDLYHRRTLLGADPVIHRSAYPNWNYNAEISAFSYRLGASDIESDELVKALTTPSYADRADVEGGVEDPLPKGFENESTGNNEEMARKGLIVLEKSIKGQLRYSFPLAPEEFIEEISAYLLSEEIVATIGNTLGMDSIIRTTEIPPSTQSTASCVNALCSCMSVNGTRQLVADYFMPQLYEIDYIDAFPLRDPLPVLTQIHKKNGAKEIEPRLVRSAGIVSAQPIYVVSIYRDQTEVIGESAGETIDIAVDMAAREGLLRSWGLSAEKLLLVGKESMNTPEEVYNKENYRLSDICDKSIDLSLDFQFDPEEEPLNMVEAAMQYKNEIESVVGKSYTRRLRHKFSRGTLARRSFRYLVKPKVYTVS